MANVLEGFTSLTGAVVRLEVSESTVRKLVKRGQLEPLVTPRGKLYRVADLDRIKAERTAATS